MTDAFSSRLTRWFQSAILASAVVLLGGCGDITGSWERRDWETDETRNTMTLGSDETGMATIHYVLTESPGTWYQDEFEIDWEEISSDEYDLQMTCIASSRIGEPCGDDSFTMSCEINQQADELDCTATNQWTDYVFEWDKH